MAISSSASVSGASVRRPIEERRPDVDAVYEVSDADLQPWFAPAPTASGCCLSDILSTSVALALTPAGGVLKASAAGVAAPRQFHRLAVGRSVVEASGGVPDRLESEWGCGEAAAQRVAEPFEVWLAGAWETLPTPVWWSPANAAESPMNGVSPNCAE